MNVQLKTQYTYTKKITVDCQVKPVKNNISDIIFTYLLYII